MYSQTNKNDFRIAWHFELSIFLEMTIVIVQIFIGILWSSTGAVEL